MEHKGTIRIETKRLVLRPFKKADALAMYKNWESDSKVTRYLRWQAYENLDCVKEVLNEWLANYRKLDFYQWAIVLKELGEPVGTISVVKKNEDLNIVQIGYCIGSKWWNQGITSEAFSAIIPFFFQEVGVNRLEAQHDPNNFNSGKVMKKCGLRYEGTLRQAHKNNSGIVDACMYSLLAEEFYLGDYPLNSNL